MQDIPLNTTANDKNMNQAFDSTLIRIPDNEEPFVKTKYECDCSQIFVCSKIRIYFSLIFSLSIVGLVIGIIGIINSEFYLIVLGFSIMFLFGVIGGLFYCNHEYESHQMRFCN